VTDYSDLITRLRSPRKYAATNQETADALEAQARRIAELEMQVAFIKPVELAQNARIAELRAALKPFDEMLQRDFSIMADDKRYADDFTSTVLMRLGDLRAARAALGENKL
jgi:acyl-CoA reductase-like NAD-dependent aldehyde dehydrogenase